MSNKICPKESVYNWLPDVSKVTETENKKPPRYISKFRPAVVLESRLNKHAMKMMGPLLEMPSPGRYLKKGSKEPKWPEKTDSSKNIRHTQLCTVRKPAVPKRPDLPLMGMPAKRDFKATNVAVTTRPELRQVDTSRANLQPLVKSGLVKKYVMKEDYGKIPVYLQKRRAAQRQAQECCRLEEEGKKGSDIERVPDEKQLTVLETLKEEWNTNMLKYQKLPFMIEHPSQKAYKRNLEKTMDELEKKIKLFERFKTICILNEEVSPCSGHP